MSLNRHLRMIYQKTFAVFLCLLFSSSSSYTYVFEYENDDFVPASQYKLLEKLILASMQTDNRNPADWKRNIPNLDFTVGSGHHHQRNYLMFQKMIRDLQAGNNPAGK